MSYFIVKITLLKFAPVCKTYYYLAWPILTESKKTDQNQPKPFYLSQSRLTLSCRTQPNKVTIHIMPSLTCPNPV